MAMRRVNKASIDILGMPEEEEPRIKEIIVSLIELVKQQTGAEDVALSGLEFAEDTVEEEAEYHSLTPRELASVLASMRLVQDGSKRAGVNLLTNEGLADLFTGTAPLTTDELGALCEKLNTASVATEDMVRMCMAPFANILYEQNGDGKYIQREIGEEDIKAIYALLVEIFPELQA